MEVSYLYDTQLMD